MALVLVYLFPLVSPVPTFRCEGKHPCSVITMQVAHAEPCQTLAFQGLNGKSLHVAQGKTHHTTLLGALWTQKRALRYFLLLLFFFIARKQS